MQEQTVGLPKLLRESRRYRAKRKQEEVAEAIGVHVVTISRWENGVIAPKRDKYARIEQHYQITRAELFSALGELPKSEHLDITSHEVELIELYRMAPPNLRASTFQGLQAGLQAEQGQSRILLRVAETPGEYQVHPE